MRMHLPARIILTAVVISLMATIAALPALAADDDDDGPRERGEPTLTIDVECFSVEVTSDRPIKKVVVYFANGSIEEIDPRDDKDDRDDDDAEDDDAEDDDGEQDDAPYEYSESFGDEIARATARSGDTEVEDDAGDCSSDDADDDADSGGTGDDADDDADSGGTGDNAGDDGGTTARSSGGSTGTTSGDADGGSHTSGDGGSAPTATSGGGTTSSSSSTGLGGDGGAIAAGSEGGFSFSSGPGGVLASLAVANGAKRCPSGPHKGMPYVKIADCGDTVLAARLALTGTEGLMALGGLGAILVATGGGILLWHRRRVAKPR